MKKVLLLIPFCFITLFSCTLDEEGKELITPENHIDYFQIEVLEETDKPNSRLAKDIPGAPVDGLCTCDFTVEVSDNLVGFDWDGAFVVDTEQYPSGAGYHTFGFWNGPNPRTFTLDDVLPGRLMDILMSFNHDPIFPLLEDGWIRLEVDCGTNSPIVFTHHIPAATNSILTRIEQDRVIKVGDNCRLLYVAQERIDR